MSYQQTILGPVWILFQPVLTLVVFLFVFGRIIGVPIDKTTPPVLFYFSGIVLWNFFNDIFGSTARTFRDNTHLFSKVYFPRIIIPAATMGTQFIRFLVQFLLLLLLLLYHVFFKGFSIGSGAAFLLLPAVVLLTAFLGLSAGLVFSVLTAKYRDLGNLVDVLIRLLIFVTPVFYSLSSMKPALRWLINLNPLTPLFEAFRLSVTGRGLVSPVQVVCSLCFIAVSLYASLWLFNTKGSKLIDVV